jgi:3-methyladenine DNA glycosylase AlkD
MATADRELVPAHMSPARAPADEPLASVADVQALLASLARPQMAAIAQRFFKTGPGQYGEGDRFRGIKVPVLRQVARRCDGLGLAAIERLLAAPLHEDRFLALVCLVRRFRRTDAAARSRLARLYLAHVPEHINNWDLVDTSAEHVVGAWLAEQPPARRVLLDRLARSPSLWRRRVAIIATLHFIRRGEHADTLRLAEALLGDREDLMHKATGWMLREVGHRDVEALRGFLAKHAGRMPRTMLRYAIERLSPAERARWMKR